jgi:thiol-disulfide isomerase/thioredoxin
MASDHSLPTEPTIVEIRTPWCPACVAMERDVQDVAARYAGDVAFIQIDAASDPDVASSMGVQSTPTLVAYRDGSEVYRSVGRLTADELGVLFDGVAHGGVLPDLRRRDVGIRIGAGTALIALGLATGPTWPLFGIGSIVVIFGWLTWRRRT